jgi:hypothetical protein
MAVYPEPPPGTTRERNNRIVATLLIVGGVLLLLGMSDVLSGVVWSVLLPLALLGFGLDLLSEGRQRRRIVAGTLIAAVVLVPLVGGLRAVERWTAPELVVSTNPQIVERDGELSALATRIELTGGTLDIGALSEDDAALARLERGVFTDIDRSGARRTINVSAAGGEDREIELQLARDVPLDLTLNLNAVDADTIDLRELTLERLDLSIQAGSAQLALPELSGYSVAVHSNVSDVQIALPDDLPVRVEVGSRFVSNVEVPNRFERREAGVYETEDFTADTGVTIRIDATAGNVEID